MFRLRCSPGSRYYPAAAPGNPEAIHMGEASRRLNFRRPKENAETRLLRGPCRTKPVSGMVTGMATQKITITLDVDQVKEIRALVAAGQAANVSAFVQHAVGIALHDAAGWKEMLEDGLLQTGGALTRKERAWADALLSPRERKTGPKKGRAA
jgi:Arc/MetJ-type ribon-helix-helix transcriptional regulator